MTHNLDSCGTGEDYCRIAAVVVVNHIPLMGVAVSMSNTCRVRQSLEAAARSMAGALMLMKRASDWIRLIKSAAQILTDFVGLDAKAGLAVLFVNDELTSHIDVNTGPVYSL